jgi:hypothetical protein
MDRVPGLILQFPLGAKLHQPRNPEGHAREFLLGPYPSPFLASDPTSLATICKN